MMTHEQYYACDCGGTMQLDVDDNGGFLSYDSCPPQYDWICDSCGNSERFSEFDPDEFTPFARKRDGEGK